MSVFEVDLGKGAINRKHGLPLSTGVFLFDGEFIEEEYGRDYGETRSVAIGLSRC